MPNNSDSKTTPPSVTLILPDEMRRKSLVAALAGLQITFAREFDAYPTPRDQHEIARFTCDVVIVDIDTDVEHAVRVIENICRQNAALTVMAYSSANQATLMRRAMQSGAREFLIEGLLAETLHEAFERTMARRPVEEKRAGRMFVFVPCKGGIGVTTIATNFAIALAKESGARVVVVDLDFQLGEVALNLGLTPSFSVVDALLNVERLDLEFVTTLLLKHSSGLSVLGAPEDYTFFHSSVDEGATKLFSILREEFDYVVVDSGSCQGSLQEFLFGTADRLYLVAEMTFPALRNGHRLNAFLTARNWTSNVEVVLNRANSRHAEIDERSAVKALGRPISWKIPNSYVDARTAEDTGVPLVLGNTNISKALFNMAKAACGKPPNPEKKSRSFFRFTRPDAQREEPSRA